MLGQHPGGLTASYQFRPNVLLRTTPTQIGPPTGLIGYVPKWSGMDGFDQPCVDSQIQTNCTPPSEATV
ncbi:protein of unknown function (plasmid) [Caballeronia sp. S22]